MTNSARPLSPHIQIYRWQATMVLSILHRASGIALAAGAAMLTWYLMATVTGEPEFNELHQFFASYTGRVMLFGWLWSFTLHFFNGIRHLVWDTGRGIDIKAAANSAIAVLAASLLSSLAIWYAGGGFEKQHK
jgi:succinate dehydrogenase / fumarate reductase cytochrome b subunit